jgi:hypothetical protein
LPPIAAPRRASALFATRSRRCRRSSAPFRPASLSRTGSTISTAPASPRFARLLRAPAPDLPALALKIDLTVDDQAWELTAAAPCLAALKADADRLGRSGGPPNATA